MTLIQFLDHASVFVFALTGALVASRAQLDVVGFIFIACLTGVGGGTVRDLLLGRDPVFWVGQPGFILVAGTAAVLVFFTAHLLESRYRVLLWLDALALGVAVPAGAWVALSLGQPWPVVLIMGMLTGCLGGLMRDVVCNEVPLVLKQGELYATAAFAGAAAGLIALAVLGDGLLVLLICAGVTFALRAGSLVFGWRLKPYKGRPPRTRG
ncbi:MAG: trimeric intracellular cation channel family protein [Paracoccaceae bacterium]